ncbi:MAG: DUF3392 family protein [Chitinispirillia bacterium]|nr:DUF3392 family protein [Chitinispirillia bacterium]
MIAKYTAIFAQFLANNLNEICLSITAVTIMIAGPHLTSAIKRVTKPYNWFFKFCCFIILCTVILTFLSKILYKGLKYWYGQQSGLALILWVTCTYLSLAFIAKQQKEI